MQEKRRLLKPSATTKTTTTYTSDIELKNLKNDGPIPLEIKEPPENIRFLTCNVAMFPREEFGIPFPQINGDVLLPNVVRNPFIVQHIEEQNPDVFALQEVWDKDTAKEYIQYFAAKGYQCVHGGMGATIVNGGVMLFSKFPILEHKQIIFDNPAGNEELWARKRALCAKLQISDNHFITVEAHHLYGGLSATSAKLNGTSSYRRGTSLGQIVTGALKEKNDWWHKPPMRSRYNCLSDLPTKPLKYLGGFVMGDFNLSLDVREVKTKQGKIRYDDRKRLSVSQGESNNDFKKDDIKYEGQRRYFEELEIISPDNCIEAREEIPKEKGAGKQRVTEKIEQAIKEEKFTGTDRGNLINIALSDGTIVPGTSAQAARRTIDGIYPVKPRNNEEKRGDFELKIISLDGKITPKTSKEHLSKIHDGIKIKLKRIETQLEQKQSQEELQRCISLKKHFTVQSERVNALLSPKESKEFKESISDTVAVSDHFAMRMDWKLNASYKERRSIYEGSNPIPSDPARENPAVGEITSCWTKLFKRPVTVSKLIPSVDIKEENREQKTVATKKR